MLLCPIAAAGKGSLLHVHASCLAVWRATSPAALERCPACRCLYVRSRSRAAALLASPEGVLCLTACLTAAAVAAGGVLGGAALRAAGLDAVESLCAALELPAAGWRQCLLEGGSGDAGIRAGAGAGPLWAGLCGPGLVWAIETAIIGGLVVGLLGLCIGLVQEVGFLIGPIGWFFSMNQNARVRVALALGSVLAARYVYLQAAVWARRLALLGETIEDYDESHPEGGGGAGVAYTDGTDGPH
jgi:hypothetical protein